MAIWKVIILGAIQGATEFLPVSSSGHLVILPWFFGWSDPGMAFDVVLHLGTLLAVLLYFWHDWLVLVKNGFSCPRGEGKTFWYLVLASLPAAVAGYLFEAQAEQVFRRPLLIVFTQVFFALVLLVADRRHGTEEIQNVTAKKSILIGFAQAIAVIPGVSRSGITISAGLFSGLSRFSATRFSFLLSTPIIFGAGVFKFRHLGEIGINGYFVTGFFVSALTGFMCIKFLLNYLRKHGFKPFVYYRLILAAVIIILMLSGKV